MYHSFACICKMEHSVFRDIWCFKGTYINRNNKVTFTFFLLQSLNWLLKMMWWSRYSIRGNTLMILYILYIVLQEKENSCDDAMGRKLNFERAANKSTLRRTLRRRMSMTLVRQKMRRLQDYSLPCQADNFRFLRAITDHCGSPLLGMRRNLGKVVSKNAKHTLTHFPINYISFYTMLETPIRI